MSLFKSLSNLLDSQNKKDDYLEKYDKNFGKVRSRFGLLFVLSLICLLIPGYLYYIDTHRKAPEFFLVNEHKKEIQKLDVLDLPVMSSHKVETWTSRAIKSSYSFDFYNMNQKFARNQNFFTTDGWNAFYKALEKADVIKNVKDNKLQVWLTPTSPALIVDIGRYGNFVLWRVEMPAVITYTGAAPPANQKVLVSVVVLQVPTTESPFGIQISQFNII